MSTATTEEVSVRDQVHDAFERVAMGSSCTLPMLLVETRSQCIDDQEVRDIISSDETNLSCQMGNDRQFRCCRTQSGQLYIERDSGVGNRIASVFELFAAVEGGAA